jgi:hypothetical protein
MASISDSDCIKAAQDVEQLDRDLDDLMRELANSSNSNGSASAEPVKARRKIDFGSLVAWLDGVVETPLPDLTDSSTQPKTPDNFSNLLTKPVEQSWLDERAMTATDFRAACRNPTVISISSSTPPITISSSSSVSSLTQSDQADSQVLAPSSQPTQLSPSTFTTPERPPTVYSTCAPKANRKSRSIKAGGHHYSRWSMNHLQEQYLQRFQPISQKRTLDRQFMIDALTYYDMEQPSKSSQSSTKKQRTSEPAK